MKISSKKNEPASPIPDSLFRVVFLFVSEPGGFPSRLLSSCSFVLHCTSMVKNINLAVCSQIQIVYSQHTPRKKCRLLRTNNATFVYVDLLPKWSFWWSLQVRDHSSHAFLPFPASCRIVKGFTFLIPAMSNLAAFLFDPTLCGIWVSFVKTIIVRNQSHIPKTSLNTCLSLSHWLYVCVVSAIVEKNDLFAWILVRSVSPQFSFIPRLLVWS
jgi:hypothetical protein